jgi:ribose 5-phosphate isomerase B
MRTRKTARTPAPKPFIAIGSDHGGFATKSALSRALANAGYTLLDVGTFNDRTKVDYPDYAVQVARAVARDKSGKTKGILICGTGTGMCIAANKVRGIRAAVAYDAYSAQMAREHNDANVLCLRGRKFPRGKAVALAKLFLRTPFSGEERHKRRIRKVAALERK